MNPAISLMQGLRLLPKFALISLLFLSPLLLVMSLLFSELHQSIQDTEQERLGTNYVNQAGDAIRLIRQHRALRHMQLSGNADVAAPAARAFDAIQHAMHALDMLQPIVTRFDANDAWSEVQSGWKTVRARRAISGAKDSYADHTALITSLGRLNALIADRSGLALDPEVASSRLAEVLIEVLPDITDRLAHIAGRGAAYIDTGLLEANEDVMLNSSVMIARRDLQRVPTLFDAVFREAPELRPELETRLSAIATSLAFLDRTSEEVLMAYNQTSGDQFFSAAARSIDGLHDVAEASAKAIDALLMQRIKRDERRLIVIVAVVLATLAAAIYLLTGFYMSFSREIRTLEQAVERTASGDLAHRVSSTAADEIGRLINAFGSMSSSIVQLVTQVRTGSEQVTQTAHGIADSNADLSARTESQASALEQTASSMEELTATVKQNSRNAVAASQLAISVATEAAHGGDTVNQAVDTMAEIMASSRKIIDIIGVIDSIAFQTNMLALNAAVEAARAEEHGRGFAVVAREVRALAQRSAAASKEIKTLIQTSLTKIDAGNQLVQASGESMQHIVASVREVAALVNDIASASRAQAAGIDQVNQAIIQMDSVTQHNAALVEQGADTAESLRKQAISLTHAVSAFKLGNEMDSSVVRIQTSTKASISAFPKRHPLGMTIDEEHIGLPMAIVKKIA